MTDLSLGKIILNSINNKYPVTIVEIYDIRGNEKYRLMHDGLLLKDEAVKLAKERCGDNATSDKINYYVF